MNIHSRRDVMRGGLSAAALAVSSKFLLPDSASAVMSARHDPSARPLPRKRFPGGPGLGNVYYGASVSGGNPAALESSVGGTLGSYRSYFGPGDSAQKLAARATRDTNAGRYPVISTHINGTWRANANGQYDQWFLDRIIALNAVGPVAFCLDHEPENDTGKGGAADFKAMYLHYKPMVDAHAPNVMLTPIIMSGLYNPNFTPDPTRRLKYNNWLDKDGCHAWGVDGYNHYSPGSTAHWRTANQVFQPVLDSLDTLDSTKPVIWAEYGVRVDPNDVGKSKQWMFDAYDLCAANGVQVMCFFSSNLNVNDGGIPWTMRGEVLNAFGNIRQESA